MNLVVSSTSLTDPASASPQRSDSKRIVQGWLWAGVAVAILSGWFVVTRLGLRHDLGIWDVIALRFGEGAILLTPTLVIGPLRLRMTAWFEGFILALLWGAPFLLFLVAGLQMTSTTLTASVTPTLMPVFAGLIAWLFLGEAPRGQQILGYALISAGLIALVVSHISLEGSIDPRGVLALVIAALMWALYTVRLRRSVLTPLQAAALICFWSAVLYLPIYFGLGLSRLARASAQELVFQSLYQGLLMSVIAIFAFNRAIVRLGARAAAAIIALVPVAATALAIPVLGEWPSSQSAIAVGAIAVGVLLAAATAGPKQIKRGSQ